VSELSDTQRTSLARAAAWKLGTRCWDLDVWQVAKEVDGRVVIYPWTPGSFTEQERAVVAEQWDSMAASAHIELVVTDHIKRDDLEEAS